MPAQDFFRLFARGNILHNTNRAVQVALAVDDWGGAG